MPSHVTETQKEKFDKLDSFICQNKENPGSLIAVLQEAQNIFGYLPLEVQKKVATGLNIPVAEVYGVVTFYSFFTLEPKGEYEISVCLGTACYVKGSNLILDKIEKILGIKAGQCTDDGKFSINACRCIGACGLAPVITINQDVYGRLEPDEIPDILRKYREA
ncbi:MAG: NAD(P)H-dependent oxidoreductase subunit E [Eubacteriales bacterium]|nr:NAD(P)H-dependent oxidoreductase subunit E [Eubacteriales bacterium]MDD4717790.1 NAD(P)H-dependent oxidoreductase subunit E [Eubacteriales bacterium]NCU27197.1 NAD(P)H-dependent oxidoreductase subunit E [Candidatus Nomurabacteria bacterium]